MALQKGDWKSYQIKALPCELSHFFDIKKEYVLKLSDYTLLINYPENDKVKYMLPFAHIKRYGVSAKGGRLYLNTGRRSIFGEGILQLCVTPFEKVKEIKDILHIWSDLNVESTKQIKKQEVLESNVDEVYQNIN